MKNITNRAFLSDGLYYCVFKNKPAIGALIDCLVRPPKSEVERKETELKRQEAITKVSFCRNKIQETDGEERFGYEEELKKQERFLNDLKKKKIFSGSPKIIKCRIVSRAVDDYYIVQPIFNKNWQRQFDEIEKIHQQ